MKLVVWFAMNFIKDDLVCGGDELTMTGPDAKNYVSCIGSSSKNEDFNCDAGLSGLWKDEESKIWKSDTEGIGA